MVVALLCSELKTNFRRILVMSPSSPHWKTKILSAYGSIFKKWRDIGKLISQLL